VLPKKNRTSVWINEDGVSQIFTWWTFEYIYHVFSLKSHYLERNILMNFLNCFFFWLQKYIFWWLERKVLIVPIILPPEDNHCQHLGELSPNMLFKTRTLEKDSSKWYPGTSTH
jgi:hypothetical protein